MFGTKGKLPVTRDDEVVEGEIVNEVEPVLPRPVVHPVINITLAVVRHRHTKLAHRHLIRYPVLGAVTIAKRMWDSRTTARYERMIRAAEATGQHAVAIEWDERRADFIKSRHDRKMQRIDRALHIVKMLPVIGTAMLVAPAVLGLLFAVARHNAADVVLPFIVIAQTVEIIAVVFSVAWGPLVLAAPWLALVWLWHVGRTAGASGPLWAKTTGIADDVVIDETTISRALEALRIPQIRDYIKNGLPLQFITPCRMDGRGTYAQIRLPTGVPAEKISRRRKDLASGLYRASTEVWPSTGSEAAILDLWIADKGALAEGAGPYPLLSEGATDVFKGLPFGKNLRGDPVRIPVIGRNTLCGGMPEQGKSTSARVVAVGYALDPTAEMRIYVPDTNFDFEAFKPRCSRYVMGAEDEHIEHILHELEDLYGEIQVRGQLLVDCGAQEVTREVAAKVPGLHPMFVLLEEAHVAIQHPLYGKKISQLLCNIVKLDRKRAIHLFVSTQAPTKDSMPRDVTRNCSNGIAFAVGDYVANDALLGQGAYAGGHRATELIPGTDRGTALCKGFNGQRSEIVQVHRMDVSRDHDQVTPIIKRAMAAIADQGKKIPGTERVLPLQSRDLLDDLDEVLRDAYDKVRLADLPRLLRRLSPTWQPYQELTGVQLKDLLTDEGVRTTNPGNNLTLDPDDLREVLRHRAFDTA